MAATLYSRRLVSIDPARRRFREYRIQVLATEDGSFLLHTWRGRYGRGLRVRTEQFVDVEQLERHVEELLHRRVQHGYVPTATDDSTDDAQSVRPLPF